MSAGLAVDPLNIKSRSNLSWQNTAAGLRELPIVRVLNYF